MSEGEIAKVLQDFSTTNEGELCLRKGDIVQIKSKIDRHWCHGCSNGKVGRVPLNYLIVLDIPILDENNELFAAIADFPGQQVGDLSFLKGEIIIGLKQVDENWWQGSVDTTRVGIFPTTYTWQLDSTCLKKQNQPTIMNLKARVNMDMKAQLDEEMDLHKGEIILLTEVIDKDWYRGICDDRSGIFPSSYVTILEELSNLETASGVQNKNYNNELDGKGTTQAPSYTGVNTYIPSPGVETGVQVSSIKVKNHSDDLSILEDDYFRKNMPSMFSTEQNFPCNDSTDNISMYSECQPSMELDIIPYGITLYPFYAQFDNELSFHEGEIVTLIRHVSREWIEGKLDGRKGIFPSSYVNILVDCNSELAPSLAFGNTSSFEVDDFSSKFENNLVENSFAVVLYNFDAQMNSDLTVKDGEVVCVVKQVNQDWCEVKNHTGNIGLCPRNYLAPYSVPNKMKNLSYQRYSLASDSMLQDSEDNTIPPSTKISELNRKNYLPDDFLQPNTELPKKDNLDDLISKNLDSLNFATSWSSKTVLSRRNSAEHLNIISSSCTLDTINYGNEMNAVCEQQSKDDGSEFTSEAPAYLAAGHSVLNPSRSAPPVPLVHTIHSLSLQQPTKNRMSDRVPHRPAPPIPLPGQKPVRRSIKLSHQKTVVTGAPSNKENVHRLKNIISAKESQLKCLKHVKEEALLKIVSQDESSTSAFDEETTEDMKYKVRACDEKIKFLTADLERLKGSMGEEDNIKQNCEMQMEPTDGDTSASGEDMREESRRKNLEQRQNVISELVFTEKEYVRDLKITYETFNLHDPEFLRNRGIDVKVVFGNISEVMLLAEDFLDKLYLTMKGKDDEDQCVGPCFLEVADRMKCVYGEYCMNHDNALVFLEKCESNQDIQKIFSKGLETLRYQIACFDMGSILIKPVQRILKYPLILNELIKCTEDTHKDKPELLLAVKTIMEVATYINEYKRRKDIVSKYLEDGNATISSKMSRLSLHSVAKKSTRLGVLFTSSLGFGAVTKDPVFHEHEAIFHAIEKTIRTFLKNVELFVQYMHEVLQCQCFTAEGIAHFYQDRNTVVEEFAKIQKLIDKKFWKDFENTVHRRVTAPLNVLVELFEGPGILIQKRYDKFLDYNACSIKAEKNKDIRLVQEELLIAKNNYEALNSHLLEELPTLLLLSSELFVECLLAFVTARKLLTGKVTKQYLILLEQVAKASSQGDPLELFAVKHSLVLNQLSRLSFLAKSLKFEQPGKRLSKNSPTFKSRQSFTDNLNQANDKQTSSQRAYLQSRYEPSMLHYVTKPCVQNEPLELSLIPGHLVAVIKKQNPMGNPNIWFVDDGASQGFVPSFNLELFHSSQSEENCNYSSRPGSISSTPVSGRSSSRSSLLASCRYPSRSSSEMSLPTFEEAVAASHFYELIEDEDKEPKGPKNVYEEIHNEKPRTAVYAEVPCDVEEPVGEFYYAVYDFEGNGLQTLTMKTGQVVKVLQQHDLQNNSEWWFVEDRFGVKGFVPANFLDKYNL